MVTFSSALVLSLSSCHEKIITFFVQEILSEKITIFHSNDDVFTLKKVDNLRARKREEKETSKSASMSVNGPLV